MRGQTRGKAVATGLPHPGLTRQHRTHSRNADPDHLAKAG